MTDLFQQQHRFLVDDVVLPVEALRAADVEEEVWQVYCCSVEHLHCPLLEILHTAHTLTPALPPAGDPAHSTHINTYTITL